MVLESLRRGAVRTVKPRVSAGTWDVLRSLLPRSTARPRAAVTGVRGPVDQSVPVAPDLPPLAERDLTSLARHFGTDKFGVHRYTPHYERHFSVYKNEAFSLLEIGIGGYARENQGGASLRMWKAYFPKAQIIGLDIEDKAFVEGPRIQTYRGDQTNAPLLRTIAASAHDLRIVVDDGSHRPEHIRKTFEVLFPLLPAGGLYAIEDTQTSYWPRFGGSLDLEDRSTTLGFVKRLVDGLNYEEWQDESNPATDIDRNIVGVHCYHNLVIVEKGPNNEGTNRKAHDRAEPARPTAEATVGTVAGGPPRT